MKRSIVLSLATLLALGACSESANRAPTGLLPSELDPKRPSFSVSGTEGAIIATDKDDYAPGEVVTITGTGWAPGETVHLTLTEDPVKDGPHEWDVVADSVGNFTDRSFSPGRQHLGVTFTLVATGPISGVSTQLTFTDGGIGVVSSAAGTAVQVTKIEYGSAGCTGAVIVTAVLTLTTEASNIGGLGTNSNQSKSVKLTFGSVTGGTFTGWTGAVLKGTFTVTDFNTACISATDNGLSGTVTANVTPTPTSAATTTTLSSSSNPSAFGQEVTFTATVTRSAGTGTPNGDVQFRIDGADVGAAQALSNGTATYRTSTLSVGTHAVGANYAGVSGSFEPSSGSLGPDQEVKKASQTITFAALSPKTYGDPQFAVSATASSGLTVSLTASGNCTVSGSTVTLTGAGTCSVAASQPGNNEFDAAEGVTRTFSIAKATATVTVTWLGGTYSGSPFAASGTVSGIGSPSNVVTTPALTFTYYSGTSAAGTALSGAPTNAGTYSVHASFAGNDDYDPGSDDATITIAKATPSVSATGGTFTYNGSAFAGSGVATGVGGANDVLSPSVTLSYSGAGNTSYGPSSSAPVNAGEYTITASFAGNNNYESATSSPAALTINKAPQSITFTSTPPNPAILGGTYSPSATGGASGNAVTFGASGGCSYAVTTGIVTFTSVLTKCAVTADQAGGSNYLDADRQTQQFGVIFQWTGFFQPVDNAGVYNSVKAGSAVPVKFALGGNQGLNIFPISSPTSRPIACNSSAQFDPIEETATAGNSSLSYDATVAPFGQYVYVWKTEKSWAGTCRQLVVVLVDGTSHTANFQFLK